MPQVEAKAVSKRFVSYRPKLLGTAAASFIDALRDVELTVSNGEFLSIVGPSGCGKTTFVRILAGLLEPSAGQVFIDGNLVRGPNPKIAMVFQHIGLLPWRTVRRNLEFPLELNSAHSVNGKINNDVTPYLELVGLTGFEEYYPHQLSGGMQQRVGLARALAREPEVLLMDEPFGSLDAQTRLLLQDELLRIHHKCGQTTIFITHDLDEAIYLSDRVVIMTKRPGKVKHVLNVPLPRPRFEYDVRSTEEFMRLRRGSWDLLKEEISPPAKLHR